MNPYDFVQTDWENPPNRQAPKQHHKFYPGTLSGKIECLLTAETLLFIPMSDWEQSGKRRFATHRNPSQGLETGAYFIPGSSLKGLFRSLVEVAGNGCYSKFDGKYKDAYYVEKIPGTFRACEDHDALCMGCRLFGFISHRKVHKGQVQISDAEILTGEEYGKFILHSIGGPNPRHNAFYLTPNKKRISGRKFYFHSLKPLSGQERDFNAPVIYPLKAGSMFSFTVSFSNLEPPELDRLLYAMVLEENMRHKIGYAKPLGLGSITIEISRLTVIDRQLRYANHPNSKQILEGEPLEQYLSGHLKGLRNSREVALQDLRRIWAWPPPEGVFYEYPSYEWFKEPGNSRVRLNK